MKVVIVVAVCLLGAMTVQGRPAKLEDNTGGYETPQKAPEESLKVSLELVEQASADSSSEDVFQASTDSSSEVVSVQSEETVQQEDEDEGQVKEEGQDSFESYRVPILVDLRERHDDGTYSFRIEQGDGIRRSESGAATGSDGGWQTVGEYSFTHPDGTHHELTYVADHNGFQPSSDMLPTPFPLEPWHLEQIAFAEAQKQQAEEEEGSSEQSYDDSADGVRSELVADAGVGDGALGDANIADAAVEDASAGDIGSSRLALFVGDASTTDSGAQESASFGVVSSAGGAVEDASAGDIGSSRLGLSVGDASTTDSGAQESTSFGVVSSAGGAGVDDASVRGTGAGDNNGVETGSSSTKAISSGDNDMRDTGLSGLAIFQESASFGVVSSAGDAGADDASVRGTGAGGNNGVETGSSSTKALSSGDNDMRDTGLSGLAIFLANHGREYIEPSVSNDVFPAAVTASEQASEGSSSSPLSSASASSSSSALSSASASSSSSALSSASASSSSSSSAIGETSNNGETSISGDGGSESGQQYE